MADRNRRTVLKGTAGLAAVSMSGLAGCSGILGGGHDCGRPGSDLTGALPGENPGQYFRDAEPDTGVVDEDGVTGSARAQYSGPEGYAYVFTIYQYDSSSTAESAWADRSIDEGQVGYILAGKYVYAVSTQLGSESAVDNLLVAADPLSLTCVEDNTEYLRGSGGTETE